MELFSGVRSLHWRVIDWYGDSSLSTANFYLPNLSILELIDGGIIKDWQGWIPFMASKRLKVLRLCDCDNLRCTPNLSAFTQLKILALYNYNKLEHFHPSIGKLTSLVSLELGRCKFKELPEEMDELKDLEKLILDDSGITSIGRLKNLQTLSCYNQKEAIPSDIGDLPSLKILDLSGTPISDLPESVRNLSSLQTLELRGCRKLRSLSPSLSELPSSLQSLDLRGCGKLHTLSLSKLLSSLQSLDLRGCHKLRLLLELPPSLQSLDLRGCHELRLLSLSELPSSLQSLDLSGFGKFRILSLSKLHSSLQSLDLRGCHKLRSLPKLPSSLQSLDLRGCCKLQSLSKLPSSLQSLYLWDGHLHPRGYRKLQSLDLRGCRLNLRGCRKLRSVSLSLSKLPSSLQSLDLRGCHLDLRGCHELQSLSLSELPSSLQSLDLRGCHEHRSLPELPSGLTNFSDSD